MGERSPQSKGAALIEDQTCQSQSAFPRPLYVFLRVYHLYIVCHDLYLGQMKLSPERASWIIPIAATQDCTGLSGLVGVSRDSHTVDPSRN